MLYHNAQSYIRAGILTTAGHVFHTYLISARTRARALTDPEIHLLAEPNCAVIYFAHEAWST